MIRFYFVLGAPVDVEVTLYVISLRDLSDIDMVDIFWMIQNPLARLFNILIQFVVGIHDGLLLPTILD